MRTVRHTLIPLLLGAALVLGDAPTSETPYVMSVRLTGMVDDGMSVLVTRAVSEAKGANALIFIVDTPGGRVDSAITITDTILKAPCKTIAYVDGMGAISAGALISYACDEIVMSPSTNMGAAQPVTFGEDGMKPLGEKETSFVRAKFASLAEVKGHNPDIAMAMVDKDIELRAYPKPDGTYEIKATSRTSSPSIGDIAKKLTSDPTDAVKDLVEKLVGEELPIVKPKETKPEEKPVPATEPAAAPPSDAGIVIDPAGKLLTLTPKEAQKYGVTKHIVKDMDDLLWQLGYQNTAVVTIKPTWSEDLYKWLINPEISMLLLFIGLGGLYLEFKTPGASLPGIVGVCALALFFGSRAVVGLADWLDIILVVVGLILIFSEIFIIPGFGIVGVLGIVSLVLGVVLSFTFTEFTLPQYSWEWQRFEDAGFTLTLTALCFVVFVIATWKLLPKTPAYKYVVLGNQQLPSEGYTVQPSEIADSVLGMQGVAASMLRPAGRGRFGDKTLQVVSVAEYIEEGTPIVVVQVEGNRYVVDRIKKSA